MGLTSTQRDVSDQTSRIKNLSEARSWIDNRLKESRRVVAMPQEREIVPLDEIRGSGEKSIKHSVETFIQGYDLLNRGHGSALHLQAPEGSGKTHVLIQTAERMAREQIAAVERQLQFISDEISRQEAELKNKPDDPELIENLRKSNNIRDSLSVTAIAWYGQYKHGWEDLKKTGINEDLWMNYEARSADNCQNIKLVGQLGENHHDIGNFCRTACPFFKGCAYYAQEDERKKKPITFFRHQHLHASFEQEYKQLVIVDEYAGSILENSPVKFKQEHIYPHRSGWDLDVMSIDMCKAVIDFAQAVRAAMSINAGALQHLPDGSTNMQYIISGAAFLKLIDQNLKQVCGQSIEEVLGRMDAETLYAYHPNYTNGDIVHKRCLPQLYTAVLRELKDYLAEPSNQFPSCIHLVAGTLELYATERPNNRHRTPMIIADATGISELYQAMFKRTIVNYSPLIRNPNAHTEVINGSDWTKSAMNAQIGKALADRKKLVLGKAQTFPTLEGGEFDPGDVPVSAELYDSQMISDALSIVKTLAERHKSLLVISHKDIREVLESHTAALWQQDENLIHLTDKARVAFAHYGATRGTNEYQFYEAVCLIGQFRVPYTVVWRKIQMWANLLQIKEYIPPETIKVSATYDTATPSESVEHRTFNNEFAQRFVNMIEAGEIRQSAGRIRAHSSNTQKSIYFFGSRPALPFVDQIVKKSDWLKQTVSHKQKEVFDYLKREYLKEGRFPSYSVVKFEYKISNDSIRKLRRMIEGETNRTA